MVYGTNTDPIAKTKGTNSYDADCEIYLAEFNQFQKQLQALGTGYGDQFFTVDVTYSTNGFDMIHDQILGCTLDSTEASNSQGNDALTRKFTLKPIKIIFNEIDDNDSPLVGTG
jgi:diphthamide synthase subunit DPH2